MRFSLPVLVLAGLLFLPTAGRSQGARITGVDPLSAKVGDVVTASGEGIDKTNVDDLYLTDGKTDIKVEITEQTDKAIKFKVPDKAKGARWALMIHAKTGNQLLEQPVKLAVE
jgi:hypothetical protein